MNCRNAQEWWVEKRLSPESAAENPSADYHVKTCSECRSFTSDCDALTHELERFRSEASKVASSAESRARIKGLAEQWAREERMLRADESVRARRATAGHSRANGPLAWLFGPNEWVFRLAVQGVAGVGVILFIAFLVHITMNHRAVADKGAAPASAPQDLTAPADSNPARRTNDPTQPAATDEKSKPR